MWLNGQPVIGHQSGRSLNKSQVYNVRQLVVVNEFRKVELDLGQFRDWLYVDLVCLFDLALRFRIAPSPRATG